MAFCFYMKKVVEFQKLRALNNDVHAHRRAPSTIEIVMTHVPTAGH